jgi:lipopolysaccharide/colanic/teichoic acid biosynthesis glycosyltransferase
MVKRLFDIVFAGLGLLLLSPLLLAIAVSVKATSRGPVFYRGERLGRYGRPFRVFKFRTMVPNAEKVGPLATAGDEDPRITKVGRFLRKYKLDELPQLINVFVGDMSLVGPRPEAALYFAYYTPEEKETILSVRPGITDYGSLYFHDEDKLLAGADDPVKAYIEKVKDKKVRIQMDYIRDMSLWVDIKIIFQTIATILVTRLRKSGAQPADESVAAAPRS